MNKQWIDTARTRISELNSGQIQLEQELVN